MRYIPLFIISSLQIKFTLGDTVFEIQTSLNISTGKFFKSISRTKEKAVIKINRETVYKILKDNDFQWIANLIIPKNGPEQQKLRINWCKRRKNRN